MRRGHKSSIALLVSLQAARSNSRDSSYASGHGREASGSFEAGEMPGLLSAAAGDDVQSARKSAWHKRPVAAPWRAIGAKD